MTICLSEISIVLSFNFLFLKKTNVSNLLLAVKSMASRLPSKEHTIKT